MDPFDTSRLCAPLAAAESPQRRGRAADTGEPTVRGRRQPSAARIQQASTRATCSGGVSTRQPRRRHTGSGEMSASPSVFARGGRPRRPTLGSSLSCWGEGLLPGRWRRPARARGVAVLCDGGGCAARIPRTPRRAAAYTAGAPRRLRASSRLVGDTRDECDPGVTEALLPQSSSRDRATAGRGLGTGAMPLRSPSSRVSVRCPDPSCWRSLQARERGSLIGSAAYASGRKGPFTPQASHLGAPSYHHPGLCKHHR